ARARYRETLMGPGGAATPVAAVEHQLEFDGLSIEHLRWQLPYGPPTEALLLKPNGARGKLPGIVGLHDHGGNKYFGLRKITRMSNDTHPEVLVSAMIDRKSTRLNSSHVKISYAVFCLKKKKKKNNKK